ncbi:MAG: cardiolipin synthase [Alloprevotella sp.]|nr:cardiolipin synthase [Alloprevotella sp.]
MWTEVFFWIAVAVYVVLLANTVLVLVLENRQPAKTVVWLFIVWFLPVLGFILFYFFGQDFRREWKLRHREIHEYEQQIHRYINPTNRPNIDAHWEPMSRALERQYAHPLLGTQSVSVFKEADDFFIGLLRAIRQATDHIHLQTYIIEDDSVGRMLIDALSDKAREGIEVRLLYDDVGNWNVTDSLFTKLQNAGGIVVASQPVRFPSLTRKVNYRNHRKICVIDGSVGFIGGMNLAIRYFSRGGSQWNDLHLRLQGDVVASLQSIFLWDWSIASRKVELSPRLFPADGSAGLESIPCQIMSSSPFADCPAILYMQTWLFQNARRSIYIQTPYFLPSDSILQALQTASFAGIEVNIMVPMRPDSKILKWANESYFADALKAGVRIFRYKNGFLHAKSVVVDDEICSVGSSNMDFRSYENNFEANAVVYDKDVARQIKEKFLQDMAFCEEVCFDKWQQRPVLKRLTESTIRIFSPLL